MLADKLRRVLFIIESVREIGAYKVLITFESKEVMDGVLKEEGELLKEYFAELRAWTFEEVCQTSKDGK